MRFASPLASLPVLALTLVALGAAAAACSDDDPGTTPVVPGADGGGQLEGGNTDGGDGGLPGCPSLSFAPGQETQMQDAVNSLTGCATITLAPGTYTLTNAITIRQKGVTLKGAGKGVKGEGTGAAASTVLVFTTSASNTNGVDVVGDDFTIRDLAIWDAKKDALRVESSKNVKIQNVRTEWAAANAPTNGAYGVYPVKSENVLVEGCEAYNASDAGIYVGQTKNAVIRKNIAKQNVAGIEIENTSFADVYENQAEDNTGGLVVFDLPGNPVAGTDVRIHDNIIKGNNRDNFGAGSSTVSQIPAGTGTFVLASRRVEMFGNTWTDNNTTDVAIVSGLSLEPDVTKWTANNFGTKDIWLHDNTFEAGSGDSVDNDKPDLTKRPLGALVSALYSYAEAATLAERVEPIIWDGVDATGGDNLTNDINLCVKTNTYPTFTDPAKAFVVADLNFVGAQPLLGTIGSAWAKGGHYLADSPVFACAGITPAIAPVTLP